MTARPLVIGIGNRFRRDDAVGPLVADRLREAGVAAQDHSGEGLGLIALWEGEGEVIVVDATRSGAAPGTVSVYDAVGQSIPSGLFHYSSHQFGLAEAIEAARVLGRLPGSLTLIGVEGEDFSHGTEPTAAVAAGIEEAASRIGRLLEAAHA